MDNSVSESFNLNVTIRIGLAYYPDLIPDGEDVADLLNQIIDKFFTITGGALDRKMGGWRTLKNQHWNYLLVWNTSICTTIECK